MSQQSAYPQAGHLYRHCQAYLKKKMSKISFSALYLKELTQEVIPFWEKYSIYEEYGGYFTCIDGDHKVYDTDKFVWL